MKRKFIAITILMVLLINLVAPTILAVENVDESKSTTKEQLVQTQEEQGEEVQQSEQDEKQEEQQEQSQIQNEEEQEDSTELKQQEKTEDVKVTGTQVTTEEQEIVFENQELKNYLVQNHDSNSDGKITETDMLQIEELTIDGNFISQVNLEGIQYAKNLKILHIYVNVINLEDVKQIKQLTNLEELTIYLPGGISFDNITPSYTDVTDLFVNLTKLKVLHSLNADLSNIDFSRYPNLEKLILDSVLLKNVKQLNSLTNLKILEYSNYYNTLTDYNQLSNLSNLEELRISGQNLTNLDFLQNIKNLKKLNLSNNSIEDVTQISKLTSIETLGLAYNIIKDISSLKNLTNLKNLYLNGNQIKDFSVIEQMNSLENFQAMFQYINMEEISIAQNSTKEIDMPQIVKMALNESDKYQLKIESENPDNIEVKANDDNTKLIITSKNQTGTSLITIMLDEENEYGATTLKFSKSQISGKIRVEAEGDNTKEIEIKNINIKDQLLREHDYDNDEKITEYDMAQIENLNLYSNISGNEDLNVIGYAKNLKSLSIYVYNNNLTDWSPIYNLEKLETLNISGNLNNKLEFLNSFTKLKNLDISSTETKDISSLSKLTNLETLNVSYNKIEDFSCLTNFNETVRNNIIAYSQNITTTLDECLVVGEATTLDFPNVFNQASTIFNTTGEIIGTSHELTNVTISADKKQVIITPLKTNSMLYQYGRVEINGGKLNGTTFHIKYKAIQNIGDTTKEIEIADPNLRMALLKLCDYNEDRKITENEALQLESLDNINGIVYDWTGIENFKNLKTLYIYQSSLKGLEKATTIENLFLSRANSILNLPDLQNLKILSVETPGNLILPKDLGKFTKLEQLSLYSYVDGKIINAKNIGELTNLQSLEIHAKIDDVTQFSKLTKLKSLGLSNGEINDISFVKNMTDLEYIYVTDNKIKDIQPLKDLANLKTIYVSNNQIEDFTLIKDKIEYAHNVSPQKVIKEITEEVDFTNGYEVELPQYFKDILNPSDKLYLMNTRIKANEGVEFELINNSKIKILKNPSNNLVIFTFYQYEDQYDTNTLEYRFTNNITKDEEVELNNPELLEELLKQYDYDNNGKLTTTEANSIIYLQITNKNKIKNLNGLEKLSNLKEITIKNGEISDISNIVVVAENMKEYLFIDLSNNLITDITPLEKIDNKNNNITVELLNNFINFTKGNANYNALINFLNAEDVVVKYYERTQHYGDVANRHQEVIFDNKIKEKLLEIGVDANNDQKITRQELYDMGNFSGINTDDIMLDLSNLNLNNISGLEYLTNLRILDISNNQITNLEPIGKLKKLQNLKASNNRITDITPLANCMMLADLDLSNNNITNIEALENNYSMTADEVADNIGSGGDYFLSCHIILDNNKIQDISSICKLKNIEYMSLKDNLVSDISNLKNFEFYDIFTQENYFEGEIIEVDLSGNYIDITADGTKEAITHFENYNSKIYLNDQEIGDIPSDPEDGELAVKYYSHIQDYGWEDEYSKSNGQTSGKAGEDKKVEAIKIKLVNAPQGASILYKAHVQDIGWEDWLQNGGQSGTTGQNKKVEAMRIKLNNIDGYSVMYRAYVQGKGWQQWVTDGGLAGTTGRNLKLEAIEIKLIKTATSTYMPTVKYYSHVQDYGWEQEFSKTDGQTSGTVNQGKKMEAIKIKLENMPVNGKILYKSHVQDIGWENWVANGEQSGTTGQNKKVEAMKIRLENMSEYSILYRAYVQGEGWQPWVRDGEEAGTTGKNLKLEAIEIKVVKRNLEITPQIQYYSHVQDYGWEEINSKQNGQTSGKTGEGKKVEAIKINLLDVPEGSKVVYKSHVQDIGWENWVEDGVQSGTTGQNKKVEAVMIKLENLHNYSVMYRAYIQGKGWQPWVQDGEIAGSTGQNLRLEAIQIKIVNK